jgi:NADPH:quinone reductase-like Zn-dependent oxidoreductase
MRSHKSCHQHGLGIVIAAGTPNDELLNKRVLLTPIRGWNSYLDAPASEVPDKFGLVGGVKSPSIGYFAEYVTIERDEVIPAPEHLDDVGAAAWPVGGLTAWR